MVKVQRLGLALPSARTPFWPSTCRADICGCDSPTGRAGGGFRGPSLASDRRPGSVNSQGGLAEMESVDLSDGFFLTFWRIFERRNTMVLGVDRRVRAAYASLCEGCQRHCFPSGIYLLIFEGWRRPAAACRVLPSGGSHVLLVRHYTRTHLNNDSYPVLSLCQTSS